MRRRYLVFAAIIALAAASLAVGTGADTVTYDDVDTLELQPADEGTYVQEGEDGEISVVVGDEDSGVNDNAVTDLGAVFTVENLLRNGATSNVTLFIETLDDDGVIDGGEDSMTFYDAEEGTDAEIDADEGVHLTPGSDVSIGMRIDTSGSDDPEAIVAFRLMAQVHDDSVFETLGSSESGSSSESSSSDSGTDDGADGTDETEGGADDDGETTATDPGPDPTAGTDDGTPEPAVGNDGGDGGDSDGADDDTAAGLIELAAFGTPGSLGVIGVVATILSVTYGYRRRLATGTHAGSAGGR